MVRHCVLYVRSWHLADIGFDAENVRFRGESGHAVLYRKWLLLTQSGHWGSPDRIDQLRETAIHR